MKCRYARTRLAVYSAEHLSERSCSSLQKHLASCPECQQEWQTFQHTLLVLSATAQPLPSYVDSQKMWQTCQEALRDRQAHGESRPLAPSSREAHGATPRAPLWNWAMLQPRLGWAALGGAVAILASVWFSTSADNNTGLPPLQTENENRGQATLVQFTKPPQEASPLITHHAAMSFDPFTDHVGATLISYSATAPQE